MISWPYVHPERQTSCASPLSLTGVPREVHHSTLVVAKESFARQVSC